MNTNPYNDERVAEGDIATPNGSREERRTRPDLEAKVTESQREARTLVSQAGLSDARADGRTTANPFHPLRQSTV